MFGLGWGEIVIIGIVALIAIGPKELPTVLRSLAQWLGKIRRMAAEFQGQFQEALREAELGDLKKQAEDFTAGITNFDPMADTQKEMERAFETAPAAKTDDKTDDKTGELAAEPATALPDVSPLPDIDIPLPPPPAPVTEKDFAPQESLPAQEPPPAKKTQKQAGGGA